MDLTTLEESMNKIFPKTYNSRPHVEVGYDDSALSNSSSDSDKNIFLIGSATDGDPSKIYEVNSSLMARSIFGSGDLVDAMEVIWDPSSSGTQNGGTVFAMRVENATQGQLKNGVVTFKSKVFGSNSNKIALALDKDAITNAYRLTVNYPVKNYSTTYTNIGNIFSLSYIGTEASAAYKVDGSLGNATSFELSVGDDTASLAPVATFDISSGNYDSVYDIIEAINKIPGFQAAPLKSAYSISAFKLDATADRVQVKNADDPAIVTSLYGDLENVLEDDTYVGVSVLYDDPSKIQDPENVTATPTNDGAKVTATDSERTGITPFELTNLSGGTDGVVPTSWADKFKNIIGHNVYYIVPLTAQENVHAELREFLNEQDLLGYHYIAFVGGGYNENYTKAISRQAALRSNRIALVANSGYYTALNGTNVHIPGYIMAAFVAGTSSSLPVGYAVTNKYLGLTSLDQNFSGDELNQLDASGIIAIEAVINRNASGGFAIVEDVTTYNSTNEPVKNLISLQELTDFLFDDLRISMREDYIGKPLSTLSGQQISSYISTFLSKRVTSGMLASYDPNDIEVDIVGNTVMVVFSAAPAREARLIVVKGTYTNFTSTTTSAG